MTRSKISIPLDARLVIGSLALTLATTSCAERGRRPVLSPTTLPGSDVVAPSPLLRLGEAVPLGTAYNLYDLVVADVDLDGDLDVHTLSHNTDPLVFINDGHGVFRPSDDDLALMPLPEWPGIGAVGREPAFERPGIYFFWRGPTLVLRAHRIEELGAPILGSLEVGNRAIVRGHGEVRATVRVTVSKTFKRDRIEFALHGHGAEVRVNAHIFQSVGVRLLLDEEEAWRHVWVGPRAIPAAGPSLEMKLGRDYHAAAWGDLAAGMPAVYLVRGGRLGGPRGPLHRNDELRVLAPGGREPPIDRAFDAGIRKGDCPGRQAAIVDIDNDGQVDLYTGCGRKQGDDTFSNLLHRQVRGGAFKEEAQRFGLDLPEASSFVWLDADGDGSQDLISSSPTGLELRYNRGASFDEVTVDPEVSDPATLAVTDYDLDGDMDVFATSGPRSRLWNNQGGRFVLIDPATVGLPNRWASCPAWVDFDNDGRRDWYSANRGVYMQRDDGTFEASKIAQRLRGRISCSWADFDGDGDRDLVVAVPGETWTAPEDGWVVFDGMPGEPVWSLPLHHLLLYRLEGAVGHWLQLRLVGPAGNRDGVGARITVQTDDHVIRTSYVGEAESSNNSHGHHRVYFGLGEQTGVLRVAVRWPDGFEQTLTDVAVDQLLVVERER